LNDGIIDSMSPRGFHAKEQIHPNFTSPLYLNSKRHEEDMERLAKTLSKLDKIKAKIKKLFRL
jgi:hypothetical protein